MSARLTHHRSTVWIPLIIALAASCGGHGGDDGPGSGGGVDAGIVAGAPRVLYTDAVTGPTAGGEDGLGGYLSIFGTNFGAAADLGKTTKVFIGGVAVANYRALVPAKVTGKLGLQQIAVQVGNLSGAAAGTALPVTVVVNGMTSNRDVTFTPCAGRVLFVSLTGNDATGAVNDIAHPWRSLQDSANARGAYYSLQAGDQIVIRGGAWTDHNGVDTTWMRAGNNTTAQGKPDAWIHITAYPGPIGGNAIEDVHSTTPAGASGGIAGPWQAIAGVSGEYWSVSNLHIDVAGGAARDAAPINFQYTAGPWRVVNNELGPWVAGDSSVLNAAGISGHGKGNQIFGNLIHDIEGTSDQQNHGIYADSTAQDWEIAYNWIHDIKAGSLVQFNDNEGLAGTGALPHGGTWPGFIGMRMHHNWLENAAKYGINYNDQASAKAGAYEGKHWNNVIIGTGLPPIRISTTAPKQNLSFSFNTLWNCMTTNSGTGNGYFRAESWASGPGMTVQNLFFDNIAAFGPKTVAGTQFMIDASSGVVNGVSYAVTPTTWSFKNNLYFGSSQTPSAPSTIGDTASVSGDPMFVNAAGGDFHLAAGSPGRAAAAFEPSGQTAPGDDFTTLIARPAGTKPDIGAYESP